MHVLRKRDGGHESVQMAREGAQLNSKVSCLGWGVWAGAWCAETSSERGGCRHFDPQSSAAAFSGPDAIPAWAERACCPPWGLLPAARLQDFSLGSSRSPEAVGAARQTCRKGELDPTSFFFIIIMLVVGIFCLFFSM